jgi:nucleotide-binding universal stress UspA family protein
MTAPGSPRILVGVSGSLPNLAALHAAVGLARRSHTQLVAIHAWLPVGGEIAYYRAPCQILLETWRQQAQDSLKTAFSDAFNGYPEDLDLKCIAVRGEAGQVLVNAANRPGDLLVIGAGRQGWLSHLRPGSVSRFCLRWAKCPTLAVPQPEMLSELHPRRTAHLLPR